MADWDPAEFTKNLVADLREHGGEATGGPMAGRRLLILTSTGARTGQPRLAVLSPTRDGDAYVVAASMGGAPVHPKWFANLKAHPLAQAEFGGKSFDVQATVAEGTDRDLLWDRHVKERPEFGEYPAKTGGRVIPMIRLTPVA
jgi:deazaflavin-dependent oxidoreductase (nitroreductase family)